jgi:hypothetical protein
VSVNNLSSTNKLYKKNSFLLRNYNFQAKLLETGQPWNRLKNMGQVAFSCGATFFLDAARHKHGWIELLGLRGALVRNTAVNLS